RAFPNPSAIGIGLAGLRTEADRARILGLSGQIWPGIPCLATNDLETAIAAAPVIPGSKPGSGIAARVLVLSGTGSCCLGRGVRGKTVKIGGWGHILGDKASGFEIGLRALKAVVYYLDRDRSWSLLGQRLLRRLLLNEPNDLIDWVSKAPKDQVAGLATEVFEAAALGDSIATDILTGAAASLAKDAVVCARAVAGKGETVQFVFSGSVILKQPRFFARVCRAIRLGWKNAVFTPLQEPSVWGGVQLARGVLSQKNRSRPIKVSSPQKHPRTAAHEPVAGWIPESTAVSPTERRHPRTMNLDRMSVAKAIQVFLEEDALLPGRIKPHAPAIEQAIRLIVRAFKTGGRLFYVGAGTSGRLGVLDASECPPTFRTPPAMVQGIMAGGSQALWESVEGAEDDAEAGGRAVAFRSIKPRDVVIGIAASGRTPFVWGALAEARRRRAKTVLLCCNPHLTFQPGRRPDVLLALDLGPELLTGSTRLKSGTATKLVLNILTTLSMVQIGKVAGNLMIDLNPSNTKLRDRAVRILCDLTSVSRERATRALESTRWRVKDAWLQLSLKTGRGHRREGAGS
ncbi:MAG: N-acetylmuramic acid 6-phosphate etherase, partial [Verrucomicrobia bacterium]|nr:N-acetylmuramic acid 6-phosphate etherase [Verrucomicrobiota bacterium]